MVKLEFYKEKEFKDTEIGKIPKEWGLKRLGEVTEDIYYGITARATKKNTGIRILRTTDIKDFSVDWDGLPYCEITDTKRNLQKYLLRCGDLIIARAGTVGVSVLVEKDFSNVIFGSYLIKVRLKPNIFPKFAYYFFQTSIYWSHITKAQGSTLKNINLSLLKSLLIPLPPLEEQKAIAKVLKDFDDLLEVIEEKIKTLQRIKKGLMEVYFTKGVFEHKEFKDTEIGRIPKEWEVKRLGEIVVKLKAGGTPKTSIKEYYQNGNIPFVKIEDLTTNGKYLRKTLLKITEKGLKNSSAWLVPENSLLLAMYGSLGEVSINKIQVATNQAILGIIPNSAKVDLEYLYYWFLHFKPKWSLYAKITTQANLTKQIVENSFIPLSPLEEQKAIAQRLKTIDNQIENLKNQKETLRKIKKKFMDLLLTGKVRIKKIKEETKI